MANDSMENICRACGETVSQTILSGCNTVLDETYDLKKCGHCGFVTVFPLPSPETLSKYYDDQYWSGKQPDNKVSADWLYEIRMVPALRSLKKYVKSNGKILDWGAGDGAWVRMANRAGFRTMGIDRYSHPTEDELLISGDIKSGQLPDNSFDAITCFHVLEHLEDPCAHFKAAMKKLKQGGFMMVELPNINSWGFSVFKKRWQALEIPTHLNHFSPDTLQRIVTAGEARVISIDHFSLRATPAVFVLSMIPALTPRKIRQQNNGVHPFYLKLVYLGLQIATIPVCLIEALSRRGSIFRVVLQKNKA